MINQKALDLVSGSRDWSDSVFPAGSGISGIYLIRNEISGKLYIGQSMDVYARVRAHRNKLRTNRHPCEHFQHAWNLYGEFNFRWEIVEKADITILDAREQFYLDKHQSYKSQFGYNKSSCASAPGRGCKRSLETRRKISLSKVGIPSPCCGMKRSEDFCKRLSLIHKGRFAGSKNPNFGKKASPECAILGFEATARTYSVTSPQGDRIVFRGLKKFCLDNQLSLRVMSYLIAGKRKQYKGWKSCLLLKKP